MKNFIKDFWDGNASKFKVTSDVSWSDSLMLELEHGVISNYIKPQMKVLDVGCANGFAIIRHAKNNDSDFIGVDFSETMIQYAEVNKKNEEINNVSFKVDNITNLKFEDNIFDFVYTTRVLINLPTWEEQKKGILECLRVTKNGGSVLISEGFYEPFIKLNALRSLVNLPPLEEHDFNRYLKKYKLEEFLKENNIIFENIEFSSIYYIGSRFLRELVTDYKSFPGFTNPILKDFYELELKYSGGGFGIQQAYIITKEENM